MALPITWVDANGRTHTLDELFRPKDFLVEVGRRVYEDRHPIHILGNNDDTSTSLEDIWEGTGGSGTNAQVPHPAAGGIQMEVVSSSAGDEDSVAGTGVQQVAIDYLDPNYNPHTEVVTMDGNSPVNTVATNIFRVQGIYSYRVGTGGVAVGTITLESTDSAVEYTRIAIGVNSSLTGHWTVPAGHQLVIRGWDVSGVATGANRTSKIFLRATSHLNGELSSGIFHIKGIAHLTDASAVARYDVPITIPQKADVKVSVISSAAMEVSTHIGGYYENVRVK